MKVVCQFGFGNNVKYYSINDISKSIENEKYKILPVFYAIFGCNIVWSFFKYGKTRTWNSWIKNYHKGHLIEAF